MDARMRSERLVDRFANDLDLWRSMNSLQPAADIRLMRLDETEKSVRVLVLAAAADPERKLVVSDVDHPAPIFRSWFLRSEAGAIERGFNELCELFPETSWIHVAFLPGRRRQI